MPDVPAGLATRSDQAPRSPDRTLPPPHRPLGVALITLYLSLATLVYLAQFVAQHIGLPRGPIPREPTTLVVAVVGTPLTLLLARGLWQCRPWARAVIIGLGIPSIGLSVLGGTAGFKTWMLLAIVLYLLQPRVHAAFRPRPDPLA